MPTLNQAMGKRFSYFVAGIIVVTASSLASFAIASTGMFFCARAIAFIANPLSAFIPGVISAIFITWAVIYTFVLHYELTRRSVIFAQKKIIKSLRFKESEFIQLKRIDPFRKIWLWGYLLPILCLFVYISLGVDGP